MTNMFGEWLKCNLCGDVFRGEHTCSYEQLLLRIEELENSIPVDVASELQRLRLGYLQEKKRNEKYRNHLESLEDYFLDMADVIGKDHAFHITSNIRDIIEDAEEFDYYE